MVFVIGLFALMKMPLDILPVFRLPAVMVVTTYTGMPPDMMEMDITNRLERWLAQASGLDHIESRSLPQVSIVNLFFQPGVDPNNALTQVSSLVSSDLHYLPPGTLPPIVMAYDPTANLPVGLVTVHTDHATQAKMWDESNFIIRPAFNSVPGAVAPVVFGGKIRQVMVYLNREKLLGHNIAPLDVVNTLKTGNAMIPTGDAKIGNFDYMITSNGMVPSVDAFNDIPITVDNTGAPIFIKDVGEAKDSSAVQTEAVQVNGVLQTYVPIFRGVGSNTLNVVAGIKAEIPKVLNSLPDGTKLRFLFDQSVNVRDAVFDVIRELVVGVLLASIVIFFFLGNLTPTFIASVAIPLSVIGCMAGLYFMGESLNLMTLGGLALVTGPLIDMAVVILENIERHLELGKLPKDAALDGTSEVTLPVLVSALALIIVFFPVVFFEGLGKDLFSPMALSVAIAVIISFFCATTLVPLAASKFFKPHEKGHGDEARHEDEKRQWVAIRMFNKYYGILRDKYVSVLDAAIGKPHVFVAVVVMVIVVSLGLVPMLGSEFFPVADHGQFFIRVRGVVGTRIEKTVEMVAKVSTAIRQDLPKNSVDVILANSGVLPSWAAAYTPNSATHEALLEVEMKEGHSARNAINTLRQKLAPAFPAVRFAYTMIDPVSSALNYGALSPIDLRVVGPDYDQSSKIAGNILNQMNSVRGITDSFIEQELNYPSMHIDVNRVKSAYLGLTADKVIKNVITALGSSVLFSPNFWDDPVSGNNYYVGAIYPDNEITREVIANIPITPQKTILGKSQPTLLRNIATITPEIIPTQFTHIRLQRVMDVKANVTGRDIGSVASDIDKIVSHVKMPKAYTVEWGGAIAAMRASFGNMGGGMALSLVLIFLLMVAQLKSFIDPLLILATIPAGFTGVFWMLFLTNTTLNIQSMMGMIMLIGIIVANCVILTDFANQRLASGLTPLMAMREAGLTRLRPILMTAISTVMALLPSSLSGANAPLARAVIGGLLTGTFLTLTFLPALYVLVKSRHELPGATPTNPVS